MGNYAERIISLFYPRRCPICDEAVPKPGLYICPKCKEKLQVITPPYCQKCGKPLRDYKEECCADCIKVVHYFNKGVALYRYPVIRQSIYRIKYEGRREYLDFYADEIVRQFKAQIRLWEPDGIVAVPLHKNRLFKRGYNQAELLARRIANKMDIPFYKKLIIRCRDTVAQKGLDIRERQNNLKKAFIIGQNVVKLNTIIIVDDIYTTGSTMDAMAQVLKAAGVEKVYYITLAVGESC